MDCAECGNSVWEFTGDGMATCTQCGHKRPLTLEEKGAFN